MQGTLSDFRVAEILQLVAVQQKTGLLRVQGTQTTLTFYFDRGVLVSCRDRRRAVADPLLDYMRRTGWLDPNTARQLEADTGARRQDLADLLLERHLVTEEELDTILQDLAQDLITSSYTWTDGSYLFIAGDEALLGLKHRMSRNIEGLLMEAARRADEWPRLLERIPGPETVVGDLKRLPDGLDVTTRSILEKLEQPITMHELATHARVPEFEVYETVAQALENKMARVLERPQRPTSPFAFQLAPETSKETPPPPPGQPERRRLPTDALGEGTRRVGLWLIAVLVCTACLFGVARQVSSWRALPSPSPQQVQAARVQVEQDLEMHRALFGSYPRELEDLIEAELTEPGLLHRADVLRFHRARDGHSYLIRYRSDEAS